MQWTVQKSSALLLSKVSHLLKDNVWHKTIEFVKARIGSANWIEQMTAIHALGSVLDGPDTNLIAKDLVELYDSIVVKLSESSVQRLRFTICWFLEQVIKSIP